MIINVTGRSTTVQDSFKEVLEKKLSRFDKFFEKDARADVTITNEGGRETVEVTIHSDGMVFRSENTSMDRLDSLDSVVDTLFRQISKNKSKLETRMRRSGNDVRDFYEMFDIEEFDLDETQINHNDDTPYKIVRSKQFALKPMDSEEAILQMNLLGHSFFMFHNADTNDVNVVYKRNDGNYGLIEPIPSA